MKTIRFICGAYNGRSPRLEYQLRRAALYIDKTRDHWAGTEQEYRAWAREVMAGAMREIANMLEVEEV